MYGEYLKATKKVAAWSAKHAAVGDSAVTQHAWSPSGCWSRDHGARFMALLRDDTGTHWVDSGEFSDRQTMA